MTAEQTYRSVSPDVCGVKTSRLQRPMRTVSRPRCVYVRQMHAGPYMCLLELEGFSPFPTLAPTCEQTELTEQLSPS